MKRIILKVINSLKLFFFKRKQFKIAIKIYEFEKWVKNEPPAKPMFDPKLNGITTQLIWHSYKLISKIKRGEKISEEDERNHIDNMKMHHAILSSKPSGKYIDLAKLRKNKNQ